MEAEKLQRIPFHQSLVRTFLLMDAEREVALFVCLTAGILVLTRDPYAIAFAIIFWFSGMWGARKMAKEDPYLWKIYNKYKKYNSMYSAIAKTTILEENPASSEFATLLPYGTLIRDTVVLNKDGSLTSCFFYQGKDIDSSTPANRNLIATQIKDSVNRIGSNWMVQADTIRIQENHYPHPNDSFFCDDISQLIENERRDMFEAEGNHFITINVLTVTYLPPKKQESKFTAAFIKESLTGQKSFAEIHLDSFDSGLNPFIDQISTHLNIEPMGCSVYVDEEGQEHYVSSLLQYLNYCLTGENHEIEIPKSHFYIDSLLSYHTYQHKLTPQVDDSFVGVVSLAGFPQASMPNILHVLDVMPMEYRINFRFIAKDAYDSRKLVDKQQKKWQQKERGFVDQLLQKVGGKINRDAARMTADSEDVKDELDTGLVSYGYFNASIVLRNNDPDELQRYSEEIQKYLRNLGFDGVIEGLNATEAFLGSLPGEGLKNIRRPIVSSWNLTHLISLASIWAGRRYNPCEYYPDNSPPLMYAATSGHTPFRINLHFSDIGHSSIIGPSGQGKSTLASILMTQFTRYKESQVFCFDKGRSSQPIIEAMGGSFYNIGSSVSGLDFYPLGNLEGSTRDFLFCVELIESMIILQGETVTPADREELIKALNLLKDQETKTITDLNNTLSSDKIKQCLSYYDHNGGFPLMSGDPEEVPFHDFVTGFEMSELLEMGEKAVVPVILYLFHEIKKRLDGRPTYIHLAEAWVYFKHPIFKEKIVSWLKEFRKLNCILVFDTQSLADVMKSGIMTDIQDNCATNIYLPNPEATNIGTVSEPGAYECYRSFGLNDTQINIIKNAVPKREYYFTHREGNRIFNLNLGEVALAFTGKTGAKDLKKILELKGQHGEQWPYKWLEHNNVDYYRYIKN